MEYVNCYGLGLLTEVGFEPKEPMLLYCDN
jgi:hypothetical protein